ncbi:DUF1643 domain-containing protein [Streptomyces antimycoticus]|uniref:DUF1643 domain-containing protein n=1 Tax=Streptomyces antimycoticus TaxID=68175 RepID=UPI00191BC333|nr:DUF1643 domain-containing protein [Streptomyces antimycoticus]
MNGLMTPKEWADLLGLSVQVGLDGSVAVLDPTEQYRYWLTRTWADDRPPALFVMLNPSTADALQDDQTIRRCTRFARDHGAGGIEVSNLFALRASKPSALVDHPDPVGPHGNAALLYAAHRYRAAVLGWGSHGALFQRSRFIARFLAARQVRLYCLGRTAAGQPRHPLYLPASAPLQSYVPQESDQ